MLMAAIPLVLPATALVIGNDDYCSGSEPSLKRLRFCGRDAQRVKSKLGELGWDEDRVRFATDVGSERLFELVSQSIATLAQHAGESVADHGAHQLFFFYYAGHAREEHRCLHLLPVDGGQSLDVEENLVRKLNRIFLPNRCKIISILCFDACREELENVTWRCLGDDEGQTPAEERFRGRGSLQNKLFASANDFLFLWACDPGRLAGESDCDGAGHLTEQLLLQLGKDKDILHLYTDVQKAVAARTRNRQRARMDSRLTFPLVLTPASLGKWHTAGTVPPSKSDTFPTANAVAAMEDQEPDVHRDDTQVNAPTQSMLVDLSELRAAGKAAVEQWSTGRPNSLAASSVSRGSNTIPRDQLQGLVVDLLQGVDGGRQSEFVEHRRRFRKNVKAMFHSLEIPLKYEVTVTDMSTGMSVCEKRESEEDAHSVAVSRLVSMGQCNIGKKRHQIESTSSEKLVSSSTTICGGTQSLSKEELRTKRLARFNDGK